MKIVRTLILVLSGVGMIFMLYLAYLHFAPSATSFCNIGESFDCDAVNKSIYSNLFGIPVSFGGFFFFLLVFILALKDFTEKRAFQIAFLSIVMLIPSLYMSGVSKILIHKYCLYCELSKALMALIIISALSVPSVRKKWKELLVAMVAGFIFAGVAYLNHQSLVPSGKYDTFAQCLYDSGMRMYGSEGCAYCAKQRAKFGDSFEYIQEIECDPRYDNAQTELCISKNIESTPTWILEDESGNEIKRLPPGDKQLEVLAEVSGCELVED